MKRRFLVFLSILFTVITTIALVTACRPDDDDGSQEAGAEIGEYYCEYNGTEYSLTLSEGKTFTMKIAAGTLTGEYTLDGEALTLDVESQSAIAAIYRGTEITLTYQETAYKFLKKVEFTVHFETGAGTAIADQKVVNGKTAAKPDDPKNGEKVFVGWYTDNNSFRNLYYFSQPVTEDVTLYARYVDKIDPEFEVTFDVGGGASEIEPRTTTGHKLFNLPTPERDDGAKFIGWYVSQFYDGEKLSYLYEAEMPIEEDITLYAVWDEGQPAFTVAADGIHILNAGVNTRYTISILAPGAEEPETASDTVALYKYDFVSKEAGEYQISVTINNETTTLYYKNKALARVTVFEVEESTILFNEVANAEHYLLSVECGSEGHSHKEIEVENRSWYFGNCEMPEDGFVFTVKATAEGYTASESEAYVYTRQLGEVKNIAIDKATELVTWNAVEKAASYFVTVTKAGEEEAVFAEDIGAQTSFSLKTFGEGDYTVEVKALARGWKASEAATVAYLKDRLATPTALQLTGEELTWEGVEGAEKYIVTIGGKEYTVEGDTKFSLEEAEIDDAAESVEATVRAIAEGRTESVATDPITLRVALGELTYEKGMVKWDAVIGAEGYTVTVNEQEAVSVDGNSYKVTLDKEGSNVIKVSVTNKEGSEKSITVTAYKITFVADRTDFEGEIAPQYLADGDPVDLPAPELRGHSFEAWYTAPNGSNGEGERYDDAFFSDGQNRTLYGTWYANEYTISFNIGEYGKDQLESVKVRFGEKITLPVPESKNVNRAFSGWHYSSSTGVSVSDYTGVMSSAYMQDTDTTLFASYVVVFTFTDDAETGGMAVSKGPGITQGIVAEVTIPSMYNGKLVKRILDFSSCPKLEVINMPDTIRLITLGDSATAFASDTALRAINVYETYTGEEAYYSSDNGVLIYDNPGTMRKELCFFPFAKSGEYTVPEGVAAITSGSFLKATALTKLYIGTTVTEIQEKAFVSCTAIESIEFLDSTARAAASSLDIRQNAFSDCDALVSIHLPSRLDSFNATAFDQLDNLVELTVEAGGSYSAVDGLLCVAYDADEIRGTEIVFAPKGKQLGDYTIPAGIVSIGEKAFYNHQKLQKITIPGYVTNIGVSAFESADALEGVEFLGVESDHDLKIAEKAFYGTNSTSSTSPSLKFTSLRLPANLVKLGANAFGGWYKLVEVYVDAAREEVDYADGAFVYTSGSSYITTVHIGEKCPAFGYAGVFGNKLANVEVAPNNPYVKSADNVIFDAAGETILFFPMDKGGDYTIPDTVKTIGASTFANRKELTKIVIPVSVTSIGASAFKNCTELAAVEFITQGNGEELTIEDEAFSGCTALTTITLPERLVHLGVKIFYDCEQLRSVSLPKSLELIDQSPLTSAQGGGTRFDIFDQCDNLSQITVAEGSQYFYGNEGVLYQLQERAKSADDLTAQYVPYEVLYCLQNAQGTITVPGTVRIVDRYSFSYIPAVTKIVFEDMTPLYQLDGTLDAREYTFQSYALDATGPIEVSGNIGHLTYNKTLKEIVLPGGLKTIGDNFLNHWEGLTSLEIPNTVSSISATAFLSCYSLATIEFEKDGTEDLILEDGTGTQNGVFNGYYNSSSYGAKPNLPIETMVLPARTKRIGSYAFANSSIKSISFDGDVSNLVIGEMAFYLCEDLEDIVIPEGVVSIGMAAYTGAAYNSKNEIKIKMPSTLESIGMKEKTNWAYGVFAYIASIAPSANITEIDFSLSTKLTGIGPRALGYIPSLQTVKFAPATKESPELTIGDNAFDEDSSLESVTLPANVKSIGKEAFADNTSLNSLTLSTYGEDAGTELAGKSLLESIGNKAFSKTVLTSIVFPASTADELKLGEQLFVLCTKLKNVSLSASVHSISSVFQGCASIETITVAEGSEHFKAGVGEAVLYDAAGKDVQLVYKAANGVYTIGDGATRIGASAFYGQTEITKVIIPASVIEIGDSAFEGCLSLEEVEFKANNALTTIGESAFQYCLSLSKINLNLCTNLSVIKTRAFSNTAIEEIDLSNSHSFTKLSYINDKNKETAYGYVFANNNALKSIKLPDEFCFLGGNTFNGCNGITEIDLSNTKIVNLSYTSDGATTTTSSLCIFSCANLQTVRLPDTVRRIGHNVFKDAVKLEAIYIGEDGEKNDLSAITAYDYASFTNTGLDSVKISGAATYTTKATSTTGSTTYYATFAGCKKLTTVEFTNPGSLTKIPQEMFRDCSSLTTLNFTELTGLTSIVTQAFMGCGFTEVDLSKCAGGAAFLGNVGTNAGIFRDCTQLSSITLPDGITSLGNYVFSNTGFTEIDLSKFDKVTKWGNHVFAGCKELRTVKKFSDGYVGPLQTYLFQDCINLQEIDLSNTKLTGLVDYMFDGCTNLTTVKLPDSLSVYTGKYTFRNCTSLREIDFSKTKITGFLVSSSGAQVTSTGTSYIFDGCTSLETVRVPSTFAQMAGYVFQGCDKLTSFDLSKVVRFSAHALEGSSLTGTITLSPDITLFGDNVFANCPNITGFVGADSGKVVKTQGGMVFKVDDNTIMAIPGNMSVQGDTLKLEGETPIGQYLFYGFAADGVTKLDLSAMTITSIGNYAFYGTPFTQIILPDSVTTIGTNAFAESAKLTTVKLPASLTSLGVNAFKNCTSLATVEFPEGVTILPNYVFSGAGITAFEIPEQITRIGTYAFQNSKLKSITIPATVTSIGQYGFDGCADLTSVTFEGNLIVDNGTAASSQTEQTYSYLFNGCTKLEEVDYSNRTKIYGYEFQNSGLKEFDVTKSGVETIGSYAFCNAAELTTVVLPDDLEEIGQAWFYGCKKLKNVNIPQNIVAIGSSAFRDCGLDGDIVIPESVAEIGTYAFQDSTSIKSVTLSAACGTISYTVFTGWGSNQKIRFYESRYVVASTCGIAWYNGLGATVEYNVEKA